MIPDVLTFPGSFLTGFGAWFDVEAEVEVGFWHAGSAAVAYDTLLTAAVVTLPATADEEIAEDGLPPTVPAVSTVGAVVLVGFIIAGAAWVFLR